MNQQIYSVSQLNREIKEILETSFPRLWVEGEISNFKKHSSGHLYFTLKDQSSQIRCAMWRFRADKLIFRPDSGMKVIVEGEVQVYEPNGSYQLIIHQIQPAGLGELQIAFEQLKQKLFAEGLFDEEHKKPLPSFPQRVGIITSPTGAAIRDIISVLRRRSPATQLIIAPVRVQGPGAKEEIAEAIENFNRYQDVEVLIVGRGGGSLEDLWAFNEELVARAIFNSKLPVVSAVGHEIDYTISDFTADQRAPTPSAAAEMIIPDRRELEGALLYYREKLSQLLQQKIGTNREKILNLKQSYAFRRPEDLIFQKIQRVDELARNIQLSINHSLQIKKQRLSNLKNQLLALNPDAILKRGYSICYKDGGVVKSSSQVSVLDVVQVKLSKGQFLSQVQMIGENE